MSPDSSALEVRGLTKRFDRLAVDSLDLTIHPGEFYALVGPNGAGKTTTLRMVAGLLRPDAGAVSIFGIDALADPVAAKQVMAWVSDEPMIYDKLTPLEYLEFVAGLWGVAPAMSEPAAQELLDSLGLAPHRHERCEGFSKGMRQKVALAGALVHDPRLIILDEPLTGLDAVSARHVKGLLAERVRAGCTVIMTTHILEVAERMADRIGVIAAGRLVAEGTLVELRQQNGHPDTSLEDLFIALVTLQAATILLFRLIGPARTRFIAQILAAIIGAGFVIALQVAAIISYGTLSRFAVLTSDAAAAHTPGVDSIVWWPARAAMGDSEALLLLLALGLLLLGGVMATFSHRFADTAIEAAAYGAARTRNARQRRFRPGSRPQALRRKEFMLLWRDPWLISQTLMQLLYLLPPALLLWRSFADSSAALVLITPVIVMAAGQLAGGLAWLTISGEDAADLVATAPLPATRVIRAKIEVVLIAIAVIFTPLVAGLALASPLQAAMTASAIIISAASATAIQLWFRVQAKRSQFRRRQTSSRLATFAEAFSSIGWAATAALALVLPIAGLVSGLITAALVAATWKFSPRRE